MEETTPQAEEIIEDAGTVEEIETAVSGENSEPAQEAEAEPTCEELLIAAQEEAAKNLDGWMRSQAEFANARKRMDKQRIEIQTRAVTDMINRLLPVIDDFDRAFDNVPDTIHQDTWFEGIELVKRKLVGILEGLNVQPIEAVGQPFDPNCHEAIMQAPSDDVESGYVIAELQKGYKMGDRIIRPSLVNVAE